MLPLILLHQRATGFSTFSSICTTITSFYSKRKGGPETWKDTPKAKSWLMGESEAGPSLLTLVLGLFLLCWAFLLIRGLYPLPIEQIGSNLCIKMNSTNTVTSPHGVGKESSREQSKGSGVKPDPGLAYTWTLSMKLPHEKKDEYDLNLWVISWVRIFSNSHYI